LLQFDGFVTEDGKLVVRVARVLAEMEIEALHTVIMQLQV